MQETWQEHIIWTKTTISVWCSGHVRAWLLGGGYEELLGEWTEWSLSALEPLSKAAATEALTCISAPRASSWLTSCELAGRGEIDGWDAWFCVTLAVVTSALLTTPKPLTVWITTNCGKFWKKWESQTTWPASWETCTQVKKQQSELNMEQQTRSKLGKAYIKKAYIGMKHKLESRLLGEISITSDTQMVHPYGRKWRRTKEPLDESERGEWKSWLKTQHSEN